MFQLWTCSKLVLSIWNQRREKEEITLRPLSEKKKKQIKKAFHIECDLFIKTRITLFEQTIDSVFDI